MFDIVIIGAGVIGLSIARAIGERTSKSVLVISIAFHIMSIPLANPILCADKNVNLFFLRSNGLT